MSSAIGVQEYYQGIRSRLASYIKSDYLANSETLLLYADELLGEMCPDTTNIAREPYIETSASYKKLYNGIKNSEHIDNQTKDSLQKLIDAKQGIFDTPCASCLIAFLMLELLHSAKSMERVLFGTFPS